MTDAEKELNELSNTFKPNDVKFSLNPNSTASLEEVSKGAANMIKRLKEFADSGHDLEVGKRLGFTNIQIF